MPASAPWKAPAESKPTSMELNALDARARLQGSGSDSGATAWFALATKPRHEKAISSILANKGHESFLPLYRKQHSYRNQTREFHVPLFPGYVFCRFDLHKRLPVLLTPGVLRIVGCGPTPAPVAEEEIAALRAAADHGLPMQPHPFAPAGGKVKVTEGPLSGVEGVVIRSRDPMRIVLSVSLLQRSVLVEVDSNWLSAESADGAGAGRQPSGWAGPPLQGWPARAGAPLWSRQSGFL